VERQLKELNHQLFDHGGGCRYCHEPAPRNGLPAFAPTGIPTRGLDRAFFSHHAHRGVDCTTCHAVEGSTAPRDVKIPPLSVCATCHREERPRRMTEVQATCVGCHTYHPNGQKRREVMGR
jgi:predicted CXXCH cytochrome family protein